MTRPNQRGRAEPSQRQLRVGELVRHAVSEMLIRGDVHDPVLEGHLITIPEVRMAPDLRLATIYVMPLGGRDKDDAREVLAGQECGMAFENYQDMRAGDVIECYRVETVQRSL